MHYLNYLAEKLVVAHQKQLKLLNCVTASSVHTAEASLRDALREILEHEVESGRLHYNLLHMPLVSGSAGDNDTILFPDLERTSKSVTLGSVAANG